MKKEKKIKIFLGLTYILIIISFLWVFFDKFSLNELTSYEFIKNNIDYFNQIKNKNFFNNKFIFFYFHSSLGFASWIWISNITFIRFYFWKMVWIHLCSSWFKLRSNTLLYIFANYFLKDLVEEKISKNFLI